MQAIYHKTYTADDLKDTKYKPEDFPPPPKVNVWDENWDVVILFRKFESQWRVTMAGPFALDMGVFFHELDRKKVPDDLYDEYLDKLSVIESAALRHIHR